MATQKVSIGSLANYVTGGFSLPEGDYALEFNVVMFAGTKADGTKAGPERLGVMLDAHPLKGEGKVEQQFISMGSKADQSYAPDPDTGKGVVMVPGGPAAGLNNKTNWFIFLKSLYDCGLPEGVFDNDFSVLDGIHVHIQNIPEPEERKGFGGARTGEQEEERKNKTIPVVTAILDDGKPWEGTGGLPTADAKPKAAAKPGPKAVAKPAVKAKPAPAPVAVAVDEDEDLKAVALEAIAGVLESKPTGCAKVVLRTSVFKAIKDAAVGTKVIDTYFADDDALNSLLGDLGFSAAGMMVKPVA